MSSPSLAAAAENHGSLNYTRRYFEVSSRPGDPEIPSVRRGAAMFLTRLRSALLLAPLLALVAPACASAVPVRNIVLVHGAWVDASGWRPVYEILTKKGFRVTMVQEPLTGFAEDVAATKRVIAMQDGPCVLVGHSYGGSVITEAGADPKVAALVYVAAHAPDVGEDEGELGKKTPSVTQKQPGAVVKTADGYTYLRRDLFPSHFAADLGSDQAKFEAQSQILTAASVFSTPLTEAAWRTKPSWGIVAGADKIISPDLERFYYERAGSDTTVIAGASHSVYESRPREVAAVIEEAAREAGEASN
jgi:pimeloyl-ACP methyl ester carboxylesterase